MNTCHENITEYTTHILFREENRSNKFLTPVLRVLFINLLASFLQFSRRFIRQSPTANFPHNIVDVNFIARLNSETVMYEFQLADAHR